MNYSAKLARQLYRDDLSRSEEVPVQPDGYRAYDDWLRAASDAGASDTRDELLDCDRSEFARAWNECVDQRDDA